jgi:hypothetical protein
MNQRISENSTIIDGELFIDADRGTAEFKDGLGRVILRVTHLPTPIPPNIMIDLVAIRNVTSCTPLNPQDEERPEDHWREAREASLARHPSTGIYGEPTQDDK